MSRPRRRSPDSRPPALSRRVLEWTSFVMSLAGIAVVLSAVCLYALMSFRLRSAPREIGIRTALGGKPAAIVSAIAKRAFLQLSAGVAIGATVSALMLSQLLQNRIGHSPSA